MKMLTFDYVENSVRQIIVEIINEIIKKENLPFERADSDIELKGLKKPPNFSDIVLWKKGGVLQQEGAALVIELKQPMYNPIDENIVDKTLVYASKLGAPYFATSNMQNIVLFSTYEQAPLMDRRKGFYKISSIAHPNEVRREDVRKNMEGGLRNFLLKFTEIYSGKEVLPTIPVDEFFVYNLGALVDSLSTPLTDAIIKAFNTDAVFKRDFRNWFVEQGWAPPLNSNEGYYDDFNRSARQYLYLLANKLMFYLVLKTHVPDLPDLSVGKTKSGESLKKALQQYFEKAEELSGDYETIFGIDFIEKFPIPDEVVDPLKRFIENLSKYDLKRIGYADLGKIFDKLIPDEERHKLGQYFTSQKHADGNYWSDVVDFIIGFTVKSPDAIVLDGAVGAGTFLIRAYARMKYLDPNLSHEEVISRLFGVDIAKFPALLSTINLAIRDLSVKENYPIIINEDFFNVEPTVNPNTIGKWIDINQRLSLLAKKEKKISIPPVNAFVGNPPYTRQEEMEEYIEEYKNKLIKKIESEWGLSLGKRSSIYVYFMLHGIKFLKEGGRIGYITSNSWLDVDYGKYLQEFLLKNTKIIALIESKVERWFEDADINTVITIAEKCNNENERNNNIVKFVQLKKPLEDIIPTIKEDERWKAIDKLIKLIENTNEYYEDERIGIFIKTQKELWEEGYDEEARKYIGSKWGKYVRAPDIFFKILEKGNRILVPLKEVADVTRGFTTGANEFFYLTEGEIQKWGIEREFWMHPIKRDEEVPSPEQVWKDRGGEYFKAGQYAKRMRLEDALRDDGYVYWAPNYLIKSPRECRSILIDPKSLKYRVLLIHKDKSELEGNNILKYIQWGENQGFHLGPTCASRQKWYELEEIQGELLSMMSFNERYIFWLNNVRSFIDARLYGISLKESNTDKKIILSAILNSSFIPLFLELWGRVNLGQGALDVKVYEYGKMLIINPDTIKEGQINRIKKKLNTLLEREVGSVFEEFNANSPEEVSLEKIKSDRRELDKIVMGEILGLSEEEQLEVYRAVIDLVKSRIEKAKSVKRNEKKKGINLEQLAEDIIKEIKLKPLPNFPDDYLNDLEIAETRKVPSGRKVTMENTLEGIWLNIDEVRIKCSSINEAKYLRWAALTGKIEVPIPSDTKKMIHITQTFKKEYDQRVGIVEKWLKENISNIKDREILRQKIIEKLLRRN